MICLEHWEVSGRVCRVILMTFQLEISKVYTSDLRKRMLLHQHDNNISPPHPYSQVAPSLPGSSSPLSRLFFSLLLRLPSAWPLEYQRCSRRLHSDSPHTSYKSFGDLNHIVRPSYRVLWWLPYTHAVHPPVIHQTFIETYSRPSTHHALCVHKGLTSRPDLSLDRSMPNLHRSACLDAQAINILTPNGHQPKRHISSHVHTGNIEMCLLKRASWKILAIGVGAWLAQPWSMQLLISGWLSLSHTLGVRDCLKINS